MEAAAKTVELLTQRTLPDTPYYLSNSPHWRYRPRPDDHKRPEEWYSTRLQYSTLLAEADRGLLLTRPDYDMREEPPKPLPRDISSLSKTGGEKKKLSLSDYKNKKSANPSTSPPDPAISRIQDSDKPVTSTSSSPATSAPRLPPDARSHSNNKRPLDVNVTHAQKQRPADAKPRPKESITDISSLPAKPPVKHALPPRPPSPGNKKRVADHDADSRPQKRSRPEIARPADSRPSYRDDPARRRDPPPQSSAHKESLLNGRGSLKGSSILAKNASPISRPRGEAVNGSRHNVTGKSAPARQESPNKPVVPPLLSPLRPDFDGNSSSKNDSQKVNDSPPRTKKSDNPTAVEQKKRQQPALTVPPLLSPTLPPIIEEALQHRQQGAADSDDRPRENKKEVPSKLKKASANVDAGHTQAKKSAPRLIVHLKIPKKLRKSVQRILAMPPSRGSGRDTKRHDHEHMSDDERQHARKRPPTAAETKKSRSPDRNSASRERRLLTTPSRKSNTTAMSRVNSSASTARTPGEPMRRTPSLGGTTMADKRPNGVVAPPASSSSSGGRGGVGKPDAESLREKESYMRKVGTQLKHSADKAFKERRGSPSAPPSASKDSGSKNQSSASSSLKLGLMLGIESILCFMQGFQAQSALRAMYGRKPDTAAWQSLFPLCDYILTELQRLESRRRRSPCALLLSLLQVFAADEIIRCNVLVAQEAAAGSAAPNNSTAAAAAEVVVRYERLRGRAIAQSRDAHAAIESRHLRPDVFPWSTLDEVTETTLRVMRKWCADEDVGWTPEMTPRDYGR